MVDPSTLDQAARDRLARWRVCLHEASHVVAELAFGGMATAIVYGDGVAGLTRPEAWLAPTPFAIVFATGREAEPLAERFDPPDQADVEAAVAASGAPLSIPLAASEVAEHQAVHSKSPSDDYHVAQWAITGHEREPDNWAGRVSWLRHQARALVMDNQQAILQVARRLFLTGVVTRFELMLLFPQCRPTEPSPVATATTAAVAATQQPAMPAGD